MADAPAFLVVFLLVYVSNTVLAGVSVVPVEVRVDQSAEQLVAIDDYVLGVDVHVVADGVQDELIAEFEDGVAEVLHGVARGDAEDMVMDEALIVAVHGVEVPNAGIRFEYAVAELVVQHDETVLELHAQLHVLSDLWKV